MSPLRLPVQQMMGCFCNIPANPSCNLRYLQLTDTYHVSRGVLELYGSSTLQEAQRPKVLAPAAVWGYCIGLVYGAARHEAVAATVQSATVLVPFQVQSFPSSSQHRQLEPAQAGDELGCSACDTNGPSQRLSWNSRAHCCCNALPGCQARCLL
eukprot:GHUV01055261.1.p1 GENE.GHUV01055261.1~~GHUV01055261.1.p1  ORF type:complete len:154 (-),score=32.01 GHUV01055261.1:853-1314(-)